MSTREAFGAPSSTGRRKPRTNEATKLPNKPNFVEPKGNQWFTVCFQYGGAVRPAPSGAATISAHGFSRGKKEQFGGALEWATQGTASRNRPRQGQLVARTWCRSSVRVRGQLPSNKITKQTKFRRTQRESMVYSLFPVRWGGQAGPVRGRNNLSPRLQPWEKGAVRGSPGMGDTRDRIPKPAPSGAACSADLALFQRPRPWAATQQQNYQTNPIPHKALFSSHLRKSWRADRVLRPSAGEKCGLGPGTRFRSRLRCASCADRMHAVNVSAGQNQAAEAFFVAGLGSELGRPGLQVLEACAGVEENDFVVWF